ncbi:MAG: xanthine dehydrogenase family protein subunit M [Chloroflexi bacterium]|nr:xanthine dehydrogenase family protein subunit M [Chloroflexota bacterium]
MYTPTFDYYRPKTLDEAIALLGKNKGAKVLAGGHSLLPAMKLRVAQPAALVDIGRIKGLSAIKAGKKEVKIGALTTHAAVAASAELAKACPILCETAAMLGDTQVRNRGTMGGSLAHADPAADYPTVMIALEATMTAMGKKGERDISAGKFFKDLLTTALKADEILTTITVPAYRNFPNMGGCYLKHRHPASSYAVVGVAAMVGLVDGKVGRVSLAVGGATVNPVRCSAAESALVGSAPTDDAIAAAAAKVAEAIANPMSDLYATADYRIRLATVMAKRALMTAAQRAM